MKKIDFSSFLKDELHHFVKLKQSSGSTYSSQAGILLRFDRYLSSLQHTNKILTKSIFQNYFNQFTHLHSRTFSNYYSVLHDFSVWLNQQEANTYVPERRPAVGRVYSRVPYIFTINEIKNILKSSNAFSQRYEFIPGTYQILFSLLYISGIRIGEALSLNYEDYIQDKKLIHIKKGKFRKERFIVLSDSFQTLFSTYLKNYKLKLSLNHYSPIFINTRKNRLSYDRVNKAFKKILDKSNIMKSDNGPRIHDFRHTFAVHRLLNWYKDHKNNLNSKLPYLSTYMGHVNICSTQIYLQCTLELLKTGIQRFHQFFINNIYQEGGMP
ncbi:MAG: tyrosine-type recombinase/integrase [bacterium]|jgi:site-specific recombinase XerD